MSAEVFSSLKLIQERKNMPYIKPENRPKFDKIVDGMASGYINIESLHDILFVFCRISVKPSYNNYKNS